MITSWLYFDDKKAHKHECWIGFRSIEDIKCFYKIKLYKSFYIPYECVKSTYGFENEDRYDNFWIRYKGELEELDPRYFTRINLKDILC